MKSLKSFDSFGNVNEGVSREQLSTALTALGFSVNENPNFDAPKLRGSVHMTVLEKVTAAGLYRAVLDSEGETDSCGAEFFCVRIVILDPLLQLRPEACKSSDAREFVVVLEPVGAVA